MPYGCFLSDLTRFDSSCRAGPSPQRRLAPAVSSALALKGGIRPRYGGLRVQGTASSPSSTTIKMVAEKKPFVNFADSADQNRSLSGAAQADWLSCASLVE